MPRGRPEKISNIDPSIFEELCALQCTKREICTVLKIGDRTLDKFCRTEYGRSFKDVFEEKRQGGLVSLRRSGFRLAEKNATVFIWLSKQWLGMKDNPQEEVKSDKSSLLLYMNQFQNKVMEQKESDGLSAQAN